MEISVTLVGNEATTPTNTTMAHCLQLNEMLHFC